MRGVEQEVPFLRHDGGRHDENRGARAHPGGSQVGELFGGRIRAPGRGERRGRDLLAGDRFGDVGGNGDQIGRGLGGIEVDEVLQGGQRERGRRVDDRDAAPVPPATGLPGALAIEGGVRAAADPPDPGQLWTPWAMRTSRSSTWRAPTSVSS